MEFDEQYLQRKLAGVQFQDAPAARRVLLNLAETPEATHSLVELLPHLASALGSSADPDRVLGSLERFLDSQADPTALLQRLAATPRVVEILVRVFAGSQFLTEILMRHPAYLDALSSRRHLAQNKLVDQFLTEARSAVCASDRQDGNPASFEARINVLRCYQRSELLRIGACDLLALLDLYTITSQLARLADGMVQACLEIAAQHSGIDPAGFVVLGMGKLGGGELNYSSDIDLLFLARQDAAGYIRLGERLIAALSMVTEQGFLYRVDMRLRPWGSVGALVSTVDGYVGYLEKNARLWEKQALLKARPLAGEIGLGKEFLRRIDDLLFGAGPEAVRASVFDMKQRTEAQLRRKGQIWGEVKLGEGSIRDIEFVVQYLQLAHGAAHPQIRSRNTLRGLARLAGQGYITAIDQRVLADGYTFLRTIEHHLQMMNYRQTHILPGERLALDSLALRLGFQNQGTGAPNAGEQFLTRYQQHSRAIRSVYLRYIGSKEMTSDPSSLQPDSLENQTPTLRRHLARLDPSYTRTFTPDEIERHALLAEQLDAQHLALVEVQQLEGEASWRVTVIAYDFPGELSIICGLMFVYGLNIESGEVFTYEPIIPAPSDAPARRKRGKARVSSEPDVRQKIVDVFQVSYAGRRRLESEQLWTAYKADLNRLLTLLRSGERRQAYGELAKRVAEVMPGSANGPSRLYPVDIEVDNETSEHYTVLHIDAPDTIGFLYEFTNALALNRIYIARVTIDSSAQRVHDTLYVTDAQGQKITSPEKQRELRVATVLIKHFTHLLPRSPNPESALLHFRDFMAQLLERPNWPDELASLERPEVLEAMARFLGVSDFLWDDFLRMQHANLFPVVSNVQALSMGRTRAQLQEEMEEILRQVHPIPQPPGENSPWRAALNAFKDREMFRIDMRHILGQTREFWEFSEELTDLTEVIVNAVFHLTAEDLRSVYGAPLMEDGSIAQMAVCALGKCGGRELGFASDIELMFVYSGNGVTSGPQVITTAEFYEKVVQFFLSAIRSRREGVFEVDLQLRPYGKAGSMAVSLEAFRRYYVPGGPAWAYERQALVRLRPIAGDAPLGQLVSQLRDEYVYTGEPFDVPAMRAMRERQIRHLVTAGTFHPKFSPGGLVDIEYLAQALQITYGAQNPELRLPNTRQVMEKLTELGLLSAQDYTHLRKAHTFLRWLIDSLRVVRGNAKDITAPPPGSEEFSFLARRMRYGAEVDRLREDMEFYQAAVQEINARLLSLPRSRG